MRKERSVPRGALKPSLLYYRESICGPAWAGNHQVNGYQKLEMALVGAEFFSSTTNADLMCERNAS
jgi:hypothetical protein